METKLQQAHMLSSRAQPIDNPESEVSNPHGSDTMLLNTIKLNHTYKTSRTGQNWL